MSKSAISLLQEYYQGRNEPLPVYEMSRSGQDHRPEFTCIVRCKNLIGEGTATTKKEAKENCARNALMLLNNKIGPSMSPPSSKTESINSPTIMHNYIGKLNEHASQKRLQPPAYQETQFFSLGSPNFQIECTYMHFKTTGSARTKKLAKHCAAEKMWQILTDQNEISCMPLQALPTPTKKLELIEKDTLEVVNMFQKLTVTKPAPVQENNFKTSKMIASNLDDEDDLEYKLFKYNFKYSITVFQKEPLIGMFEGENGILLLQEGKSLDAVKTKLLKLALRIIEIGCTIEKL